jgi:hypothetical protein
MLDEADPVLSKGDVRHIKRVASAVGEWINCHRLRSSGASE